MIYEVDIHSRKKLFPLFKNMNHTMILSYLQGHMGTAWVDNLENPKVAQIIVGIFVFYAGDANAIEAKELLYNLPEYTLAIVHTEEWKKRIETIHDGRNDKFQRYAFRKNDKDLNRDGLESLLSNLPEGYELKKIDASIAYDSSFQELSEDFTSQYESIDDYLNKGVGYCILYNGQVVCGASSYSVYDGGIEIEVDTHPDHRRRGLATVASSALILDCLERGKYPNWDAANLDSVYLAEKLGYVLEEPYDTYYINYKK